MWIVMAYQPVAQHDAMRVRAVYQQHTRFFQVQGEDICPRNAWKRDLLQQLREWQDQGEGIVLMANINKHSRRGELSQTLLQEPWSMRDIVGE